MTLSNLVGAMVMLLIAAVVIKRVRARRPVKKHHGASIGPAAFGTIYELLNEDRRRAIEVVVEDKAGYRDAEDAAGNLPDLETPGP
jgi:hypothetical protein